MSKGGRAEFKSYCVAVDEGRMTVDEACEKLFICRATWYNWKRQAGLTNPRMGRETVVIDDGEFAKWQDAIARGEVTPKYVMEWLGISSATYYRLLREYKERNRRKVDLKTEEMIEWLRKMAEVGRSGPEVVVEKAVLAEIADRLEEIADYEILKELAENRKYRERYVKWWRKKNGKSDLTYPDFDEVYKDFWALMDKLSIFDVTEVQK